MSSLIRLSGGAGGLDLTLAGGVFALAAESPSGGINPLGSAPARAAGRNVVVFAADATNAGLSVNGSAAASGSVSGLPVWSAVEVGSDAPLVLRRLRLELRRAPDSELQQLGHEGADPDLVVTVGPSDTAVLAVCVTRRPSLQPDGWAVAAGSTCNVLAHAAAALAPPGTSHRQTPVRATPERISPVWPG